MEIPLPILPAGRKGFSQPAPKPGGRANAQPTGRSAPRAPGPGPARPFVFTFLPQTHLAGGRPTGSPLSSVHSAGAARVSGPLPTPGRSARLHWGPQPSPPSPTQLRSDPGRKGHTLPARLVCESNGVSCLPIDSHCSALSSRGVDLQRAGDMSVSIRRCVPTLHS